MIDRAQVHVEEGAATAARLVCVGRVRAASRSDGEMAAAEATSTLL
jgi:hypothetical protein